MRKKFGIMFPVESYTEKIQANHPLGVLYRISSAQLIGCFVDLSLHSLKADVDIFRRID